MSRLIFPLVAALAVTACGQGSQNPPAPVTVDEQHALEKAGEMLDDTPAASPQGEPAAMSQAQQ